MLSRSPGQSAYLALMPHRTLRRYAYYDLVDDGECRVYVNKTGVPITVQTRPGRRPQIIRLIDQFGICPAQADPDDALCTVGKDADGRWWAWVASSRTGRGVVDKNELKASLDERG